MSHSPIDVFTLEIGRRPELRRKIEALQNQPPQEIIAQLVALSAEAGTPVSADEWAKVLRFSSGSELPDEGLQSLSGGVNLADIFHFLVNPLLDEGQRSPH